MPSSGERDRAARYQYFYLGSGARTRCFRRFPKPFGSLKLQRKDPLFCRHVLAAISQSAKNGMKGIQVVTSYFLLLLVSICSLLAVWINRNRRRHRLEAQSMRQHVSQLDVWEGSR